MSNRLSIRSGPGKLRVAEVRIGPRYSADAAPLGLADDFEEDTLVVEGEVLGPSLTVPVFDAGRRRALVEVERSQASRQYLAYRETVTNAVEEVENALVSFSRSKRRRAALQTSVAAYRQAVTQSRELYESGAGDFLDFLGAQDDLYTAEDKLVQSEVAIAKAYITLCKALGGGWTGVKVPTATNSGS